MTKWKIGVLRPFYYTTEGSDIEVETNAESIGT